MTVTKGTKSGACTPVTAAWKDVKGVEVLVSRAGSPTTRPDPGSVTENWRGTGTVTYTVCELDGAGCV